MHKTKLIFEYKNEYEIQLTMLRFFQHFWEKMQLWDITHFHETQIYESTFVVSEFVKTCHKDINKDDNFLSPEPGERGFTYLQVVPAFSGAKQVMTSDIIKCTFITFPGLQIKRAILSMYQPFFPRYTFISFPVKSSCFTIFTFRGIFV